MKYIHTLKCIVLLAALFCFQNCSQLDPLEVRPDFVFEDQEAITNIGAAELLLANMYHSYYGTVTFIPPADVFFHAAWSNERKTSFFFHRNLTSEAILNPELNNSEILNAYSLRYRAISMANQVIEKATALPEESTRQQEMIGEAKFFRAYNYFKLLTLFGQFYDINSEYGVYINTQAISDASPKSRNSVSEVYDLIMEDLEEAVALAPAYTTSIYGNALAAKLLLAKVKLYRGDFAESAILAGEVINNNQGAVLEPNYANLFPNNLNSKEFLQTQAFSSDNNNDDYNFWGFTLGSFYLDGPSDFLRGLLENDPRSALVFPASIAKHSGNAASQYHLRLIEAYLIKAEALARSGGEVDDIKFNLNVSRNRVGVLPIDTNDIGELLEEIRLEKIRELSSENGSTWFDLIRYAVLDDLDVTQQQPLLTSEHQYIFPIPQAVITANQGKTVQNPDY